MTTSQSSYVLYQVIRDFTPSEEYEAHGCLEIKRGDMMEVTSPVELEGGTLQQPTGMLANVNVLVHCKFKCCHLSLVV